MPEYIEQPRYSCALAAFQSVAAIHHGIPILHSGPGCGGKVCGFMGPGEGYAGGNTIPCTNAEEKDVIFGGEKKLRGVIEESFKILKGDLFVVITGCTAAIVGDDVASIVREYQEEGKPIVYLEGGGFKSNNYVSHSNLVNAIVDQYVEKHKKSDQKIKGLVNVFSTLPHQDPYWNGNLEGLKRILEGIGLRVNVLFGNESEGVSEWKSIPNAEGNLLISAWEGLPIVKHLQKKYGTPYLQFPYLPIGGVETSRFLRQVGEFLNLDTEIVEGYIQREEGKYYAHIEKTADFMQEFRYGIPRKVYSITDATYALGFSRFLLNELGIVPGLQCIVDNVPDKYQAEIQNYFDQISEVKKRQVKVIFNPDAGADQELIRKDHEASPERRPLVIGSGWDKQLAGELKGDLLPVNNPVTYRLILNCGYTGYEGGLRAIEDIYDRVLGTYR
jgi:nitrogenase molybdenum-iron protein beta chain